MRFSERMGLRQAKTAIQMDSMDDDLRAGLWNVFRPAFVEPLANHDIKRHGRARAELRVIWDELLKLPDDTAPTSSADATSRLKPAFLQGDYVDVYDLVDFTVQRFSTATERLRLRTTQCLSERSRASVSSTTSCLPLATNTSWTQLRRARCGRAILRCGSPSAGCAENAF